MVASPNHVNPHTACNQYDLRVEIKLNNNNNIYDDNNKSARGSG